MRKCQHFSTVPRSKSAYDSAPVYDTWLDLLNHQASHHHLTLSTDLDGAIQACSILLESYRSAFRERMQNYSLTTDQREFGELHRDPIATWYARSIFLKTEAAAVALEGDDDPVPFKQLPLSFFSPLLEVAYYLLRK